MLYEEKVRFVQDATRQMAEYTLPFIAFVVGVDESYERGSLLGSALRCRVKGKLAIVTALQVLEAAQGFAAIGLSAGRDSPTFPLGGKVEFDHEGDLALCWLPSDYPEVDGTGIWPEDRIEKGCDRLASDYLIAHGYPGESSVSSSMLQGDGGRSLPYGTMQKLEGEITSLSPCQFAMYFDPRQMWSEHSQGEPQSSGLHGMSGSPVWRIGVSGRRADKWSPDWCSLVGILTEWRTDQEMLVATRSSVIFDILSKLEHANV